MDRPQTETKSDSLELFLRELTEISLRHGLAITGSPVLFVMEPEDRAFSYRCDDESKLSLG